MTSVGEEGFIRALTIQNQAFLYEVSQPSIEDMPQNIYIKVPLRVHQKAIVEKMDEYEKKLTKGWDVSGNTLFSSYGILGDGVGVGKSLMVLSHIANLKTKSSILHSIPNITLPHSNYFYSVKQPKIRDISYAAPIIIVPHSLYRQWTTYIKDQTKFKPLCLAMKKHLEENLLENIFSADCILISNTLLPFFTAKLPNHIQFRRVFIDEADSIRLTKDKYLKTPFTWFITASWPNLLFFQQSLYCYSSFVRNYVPTSRFHSEIKEQYILNGQTSNFWFHQHFILIAANYFREMLETAHPLRGYLVLKCSREFLRESISLPALYRINILCRPSITQQIVGDSISPEIHALLHAGDIQSALQHLGVRDEEPLTLIQAVSENRLKELDRLKKTYEFKASIEYHTPQAKEAALVNLKTKISHLEEQMKTIRERIENFQQEICPICFDEPQSAVITPCCSRIFCAACILNSLARSVACPLCRASTHPSQLRHITQTVSHSSIQEPQIQALKKRDALLNILKEHPNGKFLIFSRYDNPFSQIEDEINNLNMKVRQVKGNKDAIQSTLNSFAKGETQCLLLNSQHAGAGLTITAATHVILLHAMNIEEEKQIIGRAYRLGRTIPLTLYRLLHPDESVA
jgi:hypothetical protein